MAGLAAFAAEDEGGAVEREPADAARVALRDQRRVYRVRGEVEQVRGAALGDYALGDHISLAARGILSTVRVDGVSVTVASGDEQTTIKYEYVE